MLYRYTKWDERITRQMTMKKLSKLFTHLLTQSNGDVEKALEWMEYLGEKYGFLDDEITLEAFKQYLRDQELTREKWLEWQEQQTRQLLRPRGANTAQSNTAQSPVDAAE